MLERVQRKRNPLTLLVGMQTSTATMENTVEIPLKTEIELSYDPAIPLLGIHTKETRIERDTCTPMFITALFIEEAVFAPLYILVSFVKNKVSMGAWIYFWAFCLVLLVYISVFVPVPYCLDDCRFVV